jgi:hypothetical protein
LLTVAAGLVVAPAALMPVASRASTSAIAANSCHLSLDRKSVIAGTYAVALAMVQSSFIIREQLQDGPGG